MADERLMMICKSVEMVNKDEYTCFMTLSGGQGLIITSACPLIVGTKYQLLIKGLFCGSTGACISDIMHLDAGKGGKFQGIGLEEERKLDGGW